MTKPPMLRRLAITTLALTVGAMVPAGPAFGAQHGDASLALPPTDGAEDATLTTPDAPPPRPAVLRLERIADEAEAAVESMPADTWVVADVAARVANDPDTAFAFVRDHIGFDPYPGALRSPQGTLAARSGNSWDRARLLRALLAESGLETRYAIGRLDDAAHSAVLSRSLDGAARPLDQPAMTEIMPFDVDAMVTRARRDHALLVAALGDRYEALGGGSSGPGPEAGASRDHAWLQVRDDDGSWRDLDPTLADAQPGETLAEASETPGEIPATWHQHVVVRVVAERETDAGTATDVVLEETLPAAIAADRDVWLSFAPENPSLGGTLAGAFGETASWVPVLYMHGDARAGEAFALGTDTDEGGGNVLGDALGGLADGEATAPTGLAELRLELETRGPDLEPVRAERILLRGPIQGSEVPELSDGHHILVSNGGFDLRRLAAARAAVAYMASDIIAAPETAPEYRLIDQLLPFAVADRTLAAVSERVIAPGLTGRDDMRAFVARPRVWVVSHRSDVDAERFGGTIDLAIDDVALVGATTDGGEEARQRLWYGVLQTALETEIARSRLRQASDDSLQLSSVSLSMPAPLTLLEGPSAADAPAASALARALDGGDLAITVGDVERTGAFWAIDPVRGATRSVQEPGLRPSSYGGSYPGGGGGSYEVLPDGRSRRLNAPQRQSGGGGLEYQVVQGVSLAIAVVGAFSAGWLIGRLFVNACDWIYGD